MPEATERQAQILEFIRLYSGKHGASPTYAEIALGFRMNVNAAYQQVKALETKGYLQRSRKHRSIVLTARKNGHGYSG